MDKSEYNKKYYAEHKDEIYKKRSSNREYLNKKQVEWAAKNPEKVKEINKRSRQNRKKERAAYNLKWYHDHPDESKQKHKKYAENHADEIKDRSRRFYRERYLKRNYGLTPADYEKLFISQDGKCAICGKDLLGKMETCIDHDHDTHIVRGLLCRKCNLGIGHLGDNAETVYSAFLYLTGER